MTGPDGWPLDGVSAASLVARLVRDVDASTEEDRDLLLSDFLSAAWPSHCAQDQ